MVRPILSDHCLSVLSVTLVNCGQRVGWIKMTLGLQVGLGPGHIVLGGDPAPPLPQKGAQPPIFSPCLLWPNGWMHQDTTWHGGRAWFSLSRALFRKMWGPSLIYEYRLTEFTRHGQWQCCNHRHFVKDSHNIIICTQNRRCGVTGV